MLQGKPVSFKLRREIRGHFMNQRYTRKELEKRYSLSQSTIARITRIPTQNREEIEKRREKVRELTRTGKYSRMEIAEMLNCSYAIVMSDEIDFKRTTVSPEEEEEIRNYLSSHTYTRAELAHKYEVPLTLIHKLTTGIKVRHRIPSKHIAEMRTQYQEGSHSISDLSAQYEIGEQTVRKHLQDLLPVQRNPRISEATKKKMRNLLKSGKCKTAAEVAKILSVSDQSVRKYAEEYIPKPQPTTIPESTKNEILERYKTGNYSHRLLSIEYSISLNKISRLLYGVPKPGEEKRDRKKYDKRSSNSGKRLPMTLYV